MLEALQIGAGRIGKGLNGAILSKSNTHITFADINKSQIDLLESIHSYPIETVSSNGSLFEIVKNVTGIHIDNKVAFNHAINNADLILTAVGSNILSQIAPSIAEGLTKKVIQSSNNPKHTIVIACENIINNTQILKQKVFQEIPSEYQSLVEEHTSFPNCVVDRIVPSTSRSNHPLSVSVENYHQWVIDGNALKCPFPNIPGIEISYNLDSVLAQKLYTLNMSHAITAYYGHIAGIKYIHEAIDDPRIKNLVTGAISEVNIVISDQYPSITPQQQLDYAVKILERFRNPHLLDEVIRVARDPKRKLSPNDRLIKPALLCYKSGHLPIYIIQGIVGALKYYNPLDMESVFLYHEIKSKGINQVFEDISTISSDNPINRLVSSNYTLCDLFSK